MGGIFRTIIDKLWNNKLPYRRMLMVIDLSIDSNDNPLHKKLIDSEKDIDLSQKEILSLIKIPVVNNAMYMMNRGDYFIIDDFQILDDLRFVDYMEFNMEYFTEEKNSFRILCKNYITEYGKIVFLVDSIMIYNNNINIVVKLVHPDKLDNGNYIKSLDHIETELVKYGITSHSIN